MNKISSTVARQNWAQTIESAKTEPVLLTDHGRPTVVMMNSNLAKIALQALEDSQDIKDGMKSLEEIQSGGKTYSLEEVIAAL